MLRTSGSTWISCIFASPCNAEMSAAGDVDILSSTTEKVFQAADGASLSVHSSLLQTSGILVIVFKMCCHAQLAAQLCFLKHCVRVC